MQNYEATKEYAILMDEKNPCETRSSFHIPSAKEVSLGKAEREEAIYLCGNSLGLQPKSLESTIHKELEKWQQVGVMGHFRGENPWVSIDEIVLTDMADLVGAEKSEIAVMGSLSNNIHLLMVPFYRPTQQRHKIMIEMGAFPSDLYIATSQLSFHGFDSTKSLIQLTPRENEYLLRTEDILEKIKTHGEELSLVLLPGVQYFTGQYFNIKAITDAAHEVGVMVGFDLAHAVGNVPVKLHEWNVDFAAWCSYKYLNSGPGGIGGIFVHSKHADNVYPRFAAWWGVEQVSRFQMDKPFTPLSGAFGYRLSNPSVLTTVALHSSLQVFSKVGIEFLNNRSKLLTNYLEYLVEELLKGKVTIITPKNHEERGCQLSLLFHDLDQKGISQAHELEQRLFDQGVVCDVRGNIIRAAPTPLYNTFIDCYDFVSILSKILL